MISLSSITHVHQHTVVRHDLTLPHALSKSLVSAVNSVCDSAEDAGASSILLLKLRQLDSMHAIDEHGPVDVALVNSWERALRRLERHDAVTIVMADGDCGPLGLALVLTADYRIATPSTHLTLVKSGDAILPDMSLFRMVSQLGTAACRGPALFGQPLAADEALRRGLLDEVAEDMDDAAVVLLRNLAPQRVRDLAVRRRLLQDAPGQSYDESLGPHLAACDRHLRRLHQGAVPGSAALPA